MAESDGNWGKGNCLTYFQKTCEAIVGEMPDDVLVLKARVAGLESCGARIKAAIAKEAA